MATDTKSQHERVIDYLLETGNTITTRKLALDFHINSPGKIISKVRRNLPEGTRLADRQRTNNGATFKEYWIENT